MNKDNFFRTSDGAVLYYEDRGEGIPIVFVNGFAGTTKSFEKNAKELAKRYRVVTFDLRGYGRSSKVLTGNHMRGHAGDIDELIRYLELSQVVLMCWSSEMGIRDRGIPWRKSVSKETPGRSMWSRGIS